VDNKTQRKEKVNENKEQVQHRI